jgi:hypothetical protein
MDRFAQEELGRSCVETTRAVVPAIGATASRAAGAAVLRTTCPRRLVQSPRTTTAAVHRRDAAKLSAVVHRSCLITAFVRLMGTPVPASCQSVSRRLGQA